LLDSPADADREAALSRAIERLAPDERALITLHYFSNLPLAEVAQVTGLTLSNVKVKLMRTRRKLYTLITHED
ncbi:MAG: sigma-70 region 4 domain-containing protein, partial [Muribaculaceae bacterium]|nr:sigma-70 region 4 domain-containing protein [Muribaculaceae bacterium]